MQDPNKCALLCANLLVILIHWSNGNGNLWGFKGIDYIKEEYIESLNKANDVDFNNYIYFNEWKECL